MTFMRTLAALIAALALLAAGCGGSTEAETPAATEAGATQTETSATTETETAPVETTGTAPVETTEAPASDTPWLATIGIVSAASGGGPQPVLEWEAVEGASSYDVVLDDADGAPYWAWSGSDTRVQVGDGAIDPSVTDGMTWSVSAYDADGALLAGSAGLAIGP